MPSSSHVTDGARCIQMREKQTRDPAEHNNELTIGQFDAFFLTAAHKKGHKSLSCAQKSDLFSGAKWSSQEQGARWVRAANAELRKLHLAGISPTA
jgi:hypothetical protein